MYLGGLLDYDVFIVQVLFQLSRQEGDDAFWNIQEHFDPLEK